MKQGQGFNLKVLKSTQTLQNIKVNFGFIVLGSILENFKQKINSQKKMDFQEKMKPYVTFVL